MESQFITGLIDTFLHKGSYFLFKEKLDGGALSKMIQAFHTELSEKFCQYTIYCVAMAIKDLHDSNVIHRDIQAANIFYSEEGVIKIHDLRVATYLPSDEA